MGVWVSRPCGCGWTSTTSSPGCCCARRAHDGSRTTRQSCRSPGWQVEAPRFKSRRTDKPRFTVADGLQLEAGRVRLAKYGWVKIAAPCRLQADLRRLLRRGRARLLNITVSRHSDGHWYATLCFEREQRVPAGQRHLRDAARKLAHLQQDFARTAKGSANRKRAARRVGRAHARVGALRPYALHAFTGRLVRAYGVVAAEDLATVNMVANHVLAAAIGDQGRGELARQLTYKTERHGGQVIKADRWFPSSKTCSCCGWVTPKLSLRERTFTCGNPGCHLVPAEGATS